MTIVDAVVCNKSLLLYPCIMASLTLRLHDSEVAAMVAPEIEVPLSIQYSALMGAGCGKIDRAYFNIKFMKRIRNALHDVLMIDRKIDNPAQQKILFESAEGKSALCLPDKVQEVLQLNPNDNLFDGFKVEHLLKLNNPNTNFFHGFHGGIIYDITLRRLKCKPIGSYLLRSSQHHSSSCILAFVAGTGNVEQAEISLSSDGAIICSGRIFPSLRSVLLGYSIPAPGATRAVLGKAIAAYPMEESIAKAAPCALLTEVEALSIDDFPPQLRNDLRQVWNSIKQFRDNPLPVTNMAIIGSSFISSASAALVLASEATPVQNALGLHGFFSSESSTTVIGSDKQMRGYDIHIVASDGNCFFHAVVDQLQQLGIKDESGALYTHELLRGLVANFVASNPALREFFVDDELTELTTLNGWVGHETIQAFANLLKVTCMIIKDEDLANDVIVNPTSIIVSDDTPVLRLYYNGINHYNSLRTTNASLLGSNFIIPMP